MSNVAQRVFVLGGNTTYLTLANEEFVRPLNVGSSWSKLRLGVLCAITPNGVSNLSSVTFTFGICSGTSAPFGAASTTNWTGMVINGTVLGGLNYNANAGNPFFTASAIANSGTRVGSVNSLSNVGGAPRIVTNTGSTQRRTPLYIDITKGSPNYTCACWHQPIGQEASDWSFSSFLDGVDETGTPKLNNSSLDGTSANTYAASEVAGTFNTFDFFWNQASFPIEVYAMAVSRLA